MSVCMDVCLFSIEIQTTGLIWMKFGMEVVLKGRKVLGVVSTQLLLTPWVQGAHMGSRGLWSLNCAFW